MALKRISFIGVTGIVQRIDARTPQLRPELLQEPGVGKNLDSQVLGQHPKLRLELVADFDFPSHYSIMTSNTYGVKIILDLAVARGERLYNAVESTPKKHTCD